MFESYEGKLLLAMPGMTDPRFDHCVIYICSHSEEGAMGIGINKIVDGLEFPELLDQLNIRAIPTDQIPVHAGGPVEMGRGFVLHTLDYTQPTTLRIKDDFGLSATVDILTLVAEGKGPRKALVALGYAGWGEGQLEREMVRNSWLTLEAREDILFDTPLKEKWTRAMAIAGIDAGHLSADAGHA